MNIVKYIKLVPVFVLISIFSVHILFASSNNEANKYYLDAYNLYKQGKLEESLKMLAKVVRMEPDHPEAHFGMGSIYFRQEKFEKAIQEFKKVTEVKPKYVEAYQRLWLAYKKLGKSEKAEQELLKYRQLIQERMQKMTGGSSSKVVKPSSPSSKREKHETKKEPTHQEEASSHKEEATTHGGHVASAPKHQEAEEQKSHEPAKTSHSEAESHKPETKTIPSHKEEATTHEGHVASAPKHQQPPSAPVHKEKSSQTARKPQVDKDRGRSIYKTLYKGDDPTLKGFFSKLKSLAAIVFQSPLKGGDGQVKSYFGKLIRGLVYYVVVIQIWLCVAASICIYFSKSKKRKVKNDFEGR